MSPPTHGAPTDSPLVRVLGPSLRERNLPGSVGPLRQLAAERPDDGTVLRVLEAVELLVDSLKAHAASAPGSKMQRTMPMVGLDRALFQIGMGNLEHAERDLQELARAEPDNDIVGRHLEAVQTLAAALSGELTRSGVPIPEKQDRATSWDEGTEVQGDEDDPFALLDEPTGAQPPPAARIEPPVADVTGRFVMPEPDGEARGAAAAGPSAPRATMDATPHARRARTAADPEGTRVDKRPAGRGGPAAYRRLCEDRGPVLVRPVIAIT